MSYDLLVEMMRTFKDAEVRLKETLPGYESRTQQQALAEAIELTMAGGGEHKHLVAEAGCGTGKSLGYLIPAILSGRRTIISTATKALQDQVANKDVPFLQENLGVDFTFALLKGRSNYLCLNKAQDADASKVARLGDILREANTEGFGGERESLSFEVTNAEWMQVCADTDDCQSYNCKETGVCFAQIAKARAMEAQIVVVNHALFFTDLMVREMTGGFASLLDEYSVVVFDEAHEIEEYASNVLGSQFSEATLRSLVAEIRNWTHRVGGSEADAAFEAARSMMDAGDALWNVFKAMAKSEGKRFEARRIRQADLVESEDEWVNLALRLQELHAAVTAVKLEEVGVTDLRALKKSKDRLQRRISSTAQRFTDLIVADFSDLVRWIEEESMKNGEKRMVLKSSPVHVGRILREWLFGKDDGPIAVLTSATILVNGSAKFIAERLGVDDYGTLDVGTPFDFAKQAALYIPEHLPAPAGQHKERWNSMSVAEIGELVKMSDGRALLLFTSSAQMKSAHAMLEPMLPYTCLMQGQSPNKDLAAKFMEDTHSVLFATRSFFTGVDFQGEACSLVVMDKLPFPVPTEPLTEAKCDAIRAAGGNEFMDFVVPVMSLVLKQGFGRLIRHRNDRGVVAILDSRLTSKPYGKVILNSLPPARRVAKAAEVKEVFASMTNG